MFHMHPKVALSEGFSLWLDERSGVAAWPMDPYGTSLRNTFRAIPWLQAVKQGKDIPHKTDRSKNQAVTDLGKLASLVSGSRGQNNVELTRTGGLVLDAWESAGALDNSDEHEVARCILLIRQVVRQGNARDRAHYGRLYRNWLELRSIQPAEYWWNDLRRMILPCYLNWADSRGYNPFYILLEATGGEFPDGKDWVDWETSETAAGRSELKNLIDTVDNNHRSGGSRNFRRALELIYVSHTSPSGLPKTIDRWSL
jgi:hypothetical protein